MRWYRRSRTRRSACPRTAAGESICVAGCQRCSRGGRRHAFHCSCATAGNVSPAARVAATQASEPAAGTLARPGRTGFEPDGVAFWNPLSGLLVGTVTTPECLAGSSACPGGLVERTSDGGRRWQIIDRVSIPLEAVTAAGRGVAWVTTGHCGAASPDACGSRLLVLTVDWGPHWTRRPGIAVTSLSPLSAAAAWAVQPEPGAFPQGSNLVQTTDGGRSWHRATEPCVRGFGWSAWAVDFATAARGWVMCVSQPATDMQPKAVYGTTDGGIQWQLKSRTCGFGSNGRPTGQVGTLARVGYLPGFQMLADGYGWEWTSRGGLAATSDGGSRWATLAARVVTDDINSVVSASLVSDTTGYLLISQPENQRGCPGEAAARSCCPQQTAAAPGPRWPLGRHHADERDHLRAGRRRTPASHCCHAQRRQAVSGEAENAGHDTL